MIIEVALALVLTVQQPTPPRTTLVFGPQTPNITMDQKLAKQLLASLQKRKQLTPAQYRTLVALTLALGTRTEPLCVVVLSPDELEHARWQRQAGAAQLTRPCEEN